MKLGLVTYNLAKDWDLPTIVQRCVATGFEGIELRTSHAHGVESSLDQAERRRVRELFADSPVALVGLGTAFEYHAIDPDEVRRNVEGTKEYALLARDIGAPGVKVRPNGHQEAAGVPRPRTLEQIGRALRECGEFAADYGVEIRLEMHGGVADARDIREILLVADHPNVGVCWNSNPVDVKAGSIRGDFELVRGWIRLVHIGELWNPAYRYRELFARLEETGYAGYCCAEIPASLEPERLMRYYRALWRCLAARPEDG
ncbi:MAG: sugar phosphate isomerase/epimerase [Chloroflexi bacterium]|nr:sugar phosphate isomerase/epimerase [Chloroflexota bacterium]